MAGIYVNLMSCNIFIASHGNLDSAISPGQFPVIPAKYLWIVILFLAYFPLNVYLAIITTIKKINLNLH